MSIIKPGQGIGPNHYELPIDVLPPGRETEVAQIQEHVDLEDNTVILGETMTGKTTLLKYTLHLNAGVYTSFEGLRSLQSFLKEIEFQKDRVLSPDDIHTPVLIGIDEFGLLAKFDQLEKQKVLDFMRTEFDAKRVIWIIICHGPLAEIDASLEELFPHIVRVSL